MKNRYAGKCENCSTYVPVGKGKWRISPKQVQNFLGLRCYICSTTTKKNIGVVNERATLAQIIK